MNVLLIVPLPSCSSYEEWRNPGLLHQYYLFICELVRLLSIPHLINLKNVRSCDYSGTLVGV